MLSRAEIQFVKSLTRKKERTAAGLFIAEGTKIVDDLAASRCEIAEIFALPGWFVERRDSLPPAVAMHEVTATELERISTLVTPHDVLALVRIPRHEFDAGRLRKQLIVGLDGVQDPGNLGAILRICDWFGVDDVLTSPNCADCFNPKVVQATMGSIARVRVHSLDLAAAVKALRDAGQSIYGATLAGADVSKESLTKNAVVLMGNESRGLSRELIDLCTKEIAIPKYGGGAVKAESLNVATAAGILCSEFRRRRE